MPITSDMPSSESVSSVRPISFITVIAIASESGIEMQTTMALRHERRKNTIANPVSSMASASVRTTMSICCSVNLDWTLITLNLISGNCRSTEGSAAMTALDESTSLACEVF